MLGGCTWLRWGLLPRELPLLLRLRWDRDPFGDGFRPGERPGFRLGDLLGEREGSLPGERDELEVTAGKRHAPPLRHLPFQEELAHSVVR